MRRSAWIVPIVVLVAAVVGTAATASGSPRRPGAAGTLDSDFNGDGYQDLAVGVPYRDVTVQGIIQDNAGAVQIWSGSATGLVRGKMWTKQSKGVRGKSQANEQWGAQTETADFDGDGFSDLVVTSVPARTYSVLYGSPTGLTSSGDQLVTVPGLILGITTGDFDGNGYGDLAVGSSEPSGYRSVHVWYGSASGIDTTSEEEWDQDTPGIPDQNEAGDDFGSTLTSGDFNGDGADDLSVGAPCESLGQLLCPGQVWTIYGSPTGLTSAGAQAWNQDTSGILGVAEYLEYWSWTQRAGDFNGDGYADLAVSGPGASQELNIIYGSATGLTAVGDQLGSGYWEALTPGDFNGDGKADLAAGCFPCNAGGFVRVWNGSASGLDFMNHTDWSQDSPGIRDATELGDDFGGALASGNFGYGGQDDLAVGAFGEEIKGLLEVGVAHSIFGSPNGLTSSGNQLLKEKPLVQYDLYGYSLNGEEDISH